MTPREKPRRAIGPAIGRPSDTRLGTEPIGRLMVSLAIPATISMAVNALYNLVDAIFVGQAVGPVAIGALAVAFPLQMIILATAQTFGIGAASIVSRALGAGDRERAAHAAGGAFGFAVLTVGAIALLVGSSLDAVLVLFGASPEIVPYGRDYLQPILISAPLVAGAMSANALLRAEGRMKVAMTTMLVGQGLNIILDPIFIFGLQMGIRGAGIATAIGQTSAFTFVLWFYLSGRSGLPLKLRHLIPGRRLLGESVALGLPVFLRQGSTSLIAVLINNILNTLGGTLSIAVYGTVNRLMLFMLMPMFGLVQAYQPLVGYNHGARLSSRVRETNRIAMLMITGYAIVAVGLMELFPQPLIRLFTTDEALIAAGIPALRIVIAMLPAVGIQIIGASFFLSIGRAVPALILGLLRQVLLLIPLVLILPRFFGVTGVWLAFPTADFVSTVVTALVFAAATRQAIAEIGRAHV